MRHSIAGAAGLAFLVGALTAPVHAGPVIFDNGASNQSGAGLSDITILTRDQEADDFVLAPGANVIADVHWWGIYAFFDSPADPDNFFIRIFADAGGSPANADPLYEINVGDVGRMATGNSTPSGISHEDSAEYAYWATIAPLTLDPGVTYWLSIVNQTPLDGDRWAWSASSLTGGGEYFRYKEVADPTIGDWMMGFASMAFYLTGPEAVPEPPALLLFAAALAGLGLLQWRRHGRAGRRPAA